MSPFKSIKGRSLGKLLEGYKSSDIGKGFGSGDDGGGGANISNIASLNALASWSVLPNEDAYEDSGAQRTYYNGARYRVTSNGQVEFNNYEYPMYGKTDLRGADADKDCVFQLYGFGGTASNFNTSATDGNLFQMGVYWESGPNTDSLTNSLEATAAVSGGEAAYIVNSGTGSKTWGFYNGGSSDNSEAQGSTNRESQQSISWTDQDLTFIVYGEDAGSNSSKVKMFMGETLLRTYTSTVGTGRPVFTYLGGGYPSGMATAWSNGLPKFRTANFTAGVLAI
jgi:hypothetical protein